MEGGGSFIDAGVNFDMRLEKGRLEGMLKGYEKKYEQESEKEY